MNEGTSLRVVEGDALRVPIRRDKSGRRAFCAHRHIVVHPDERKVTCDDCNAELDPIAALDDLAHHIDHYDAARDRAKADAKRAHQALAEVKRDLANAKARLRRAQAAVHP